MLPDPPITIMHFNLSDNWRCPPAAEQMRSHRWLEGGREGIGRMHVLYLTVKKLTKIHLRVAIYPMKCG